MGKKRRIRSGPTDHGIKWSAEDVIILLSWLDFSLLRDEEIDFKVEVVKALSGQYTVQKIEDKLKRLWDTKGPDDVPGVRRKHWRQDVYVRGSGAYDNKNTGLGHVEKQQIAEAVKKLEGEHIGRRIATSSQSARELRSRSRFSLTPATLTSELQTPFRNISRTQSIRSVTPRRAQREIRDTESLESSSAKKKARIQNEQNQPTSTPTSDRTKIDGSLSVLRFSNPSPRCDYLEHNSSSGTEIKHSVVSGDEQIIVVEQRMSNSFKGIGTADNSANSLNGESRTRCECGILETGIDGKMSWIQCGHCQYWVHVECVQYSCNQCTRNSSETVDNAEANVDNNYGITALDGAKRKISVLQAQLEESRISLEEEKAHVKQLEKERGWRFQAREDLCSQPQRSTEEIIARYTQDIYNLNIQLDSRSRLGVFTKLASKPLQTFYGEFEADQQEIWILSQQIMTSVNSRASQLDSFQQYPELCLLALQAIGLPDIQSATAQQSTSILDFDAQTVARILTNMAIREWALKSPFPFDVPEPSRILQHYREVVFQQDGSCALRNLDIAALNAYVESEELHASIKKKSASLAIILSQTLAPLFMKEPMNPNTKSYDGFSTWEEESEEWGQRQMRLERLFELALTSKAKSCLNLECYWAKQYSPGTLFDRQTMKAESIEGAPDSRNHQGKFVRVCLQPAIFYHAREDPSRATKVTDSLVHTNNFVLEDEPPLPDTWILIKGLKAVVILMEEEHVQLISSAKP